MSLLWQGIRSGAAGVLLTLVACGGEEIPPLQRNDPVREWRFEVYPRSGGALVTLPPPNHGGKQTAGKVEEMVSFGQGFGGSDITLSTESLPADGTARGGVVSSADGVTYAVLAESPYAPKNGEPDANGGRTTLKQMQSFVKLAADARLTFTVSYVDIEIRDYQPPPNPDRPDLLITGEALLSVGAFKPGASDYFFYTAGTARVSGAYDVFIPYAQDESFSRTHLWNLADDFDFTSRRSYYDPSTGTDRETVSGCPGTRAYLKLKRPLTVNVNLSSVGIGEEFTLRTDTYASALNRRAQTKLDCLATSVFAYLQDPSGISGTTVTFAGLEPTNRPQPAPPVGALLPPAACLPGPGPNAEAGVLQFDAASYSVGEYAGAPSRITVTRTGGSRGAVTATFRTSDGTAAPAGTSTPALAGVDYVPVNATVFFAEGDASPRSVTVPTIQNQVRALNKTLNLRLSEPGNCAGLGAQTTAVLTLVDDAGAALPPGPSGLDASFGTAGKSVLERFGGDRSGMALQADGKIVMVGGTFTDFLVARFNTDGSVDRSFDGDGMVTTDMGSGLRVEEALAVAIQRDGKIVVVGYTAVDAAPPAPDLPPTFAIARYNSDGSLDTSFGTGGRVSGNVNGIARAVAIQPDGKILLAGEVEFQLPNGDFASDFAVARFNTNGSLDLPFGGNGTGRLTTDIGGGANGGRNLVLQPNGAIVVSGTPQCSQAGCDHTDVVRYNANGTLDASFGSGGMLTLAGATVSEGLVRQPDGKLVLVGSIVQPVAPATARFVLMRRNADGSPDASFGTAGTASAALSDNATASGVALQADGKLVVVGTRAFSANANFIVARFDTNGRLDTGFGNLGTLSIDFFRFDDIGENVLVQPDGKIVVSGQAQNSVSGYGLARINP